MYQDSFFNELIVDNFAGGGGASVGIELAVGRPVDIAINHNPDAIAMHAVNHPYTTHYQEDVFAVDPVSVTGGREVGIAWFSPDCRHFSRAKGNKPVEQKIRGLSWVILKWAISPVAPRCIFMENVEEIQTWGPLIPNPKDPEKMIPDPDRAGETFEGFIKMLTTGISPDHPALAEACAFLGYEHGSKEEQALIDGLGYVVDWRSLKACDYGAPTIRKRFVLIARRDGKPIVFPKVTHGKGKGLKPYRTAAECIDWSLPCPSIFDRQKPLVENTLRRIARGMDKFVIKNPKPYILEMNFDNSFQDADKPMSTQTSANHHYLITPNLVQANYENPPQDVNKPMSTQTAVNKHFVFTPTLVECSHKSGRGTHSVSEPLNCQTSKACYAATTPYLMHYYGGEDHASKTDSPIPTVTVEPRHYLCTSHLCVLRKNMDGKSVSEPLPTLTTSAGHFAEIRTHLLKYEEGANVNNWEKVRELLNKYAGYTLADNEIIVFEINGTYYFIADIGMRMLEPEELKLAQGFPKDYIINIEPFIGKRYSKAKQIARLGNAVCPPMATALIRANCPELCYKLELRTVAELEKAILRSAV